MGVSPQMGVETVQQGLHPSAIDAVHAAKVDLELTSCAESRCRCLSQGVSGQTHRFLDGADGLRRAARSDEPSDSESRDLIGSTAWPKYFMSSSNPSSRIGTR